ncbi:WD repeat-containing protein 44-like [Asterias rubens]|uniref:WD repeat-containing protein 44-like n=1 Tax=Asterias rubens TaxID=7604 RepID=UPI001455219C|nr:WD repeat-containing protein 44-like [Asterias rubens]
MSSESDSDEFYDAEDEELAAARGYGASPPRRAVKETQKPVAISEFEEELHRLATERRNAEERRKQEEEALQRKIEEIEAKKEEEEEKERQRILEEQRKKEKQREEDERRKHEEEERQLEQQEAEQRRIEAEKRRKRLEQMRLHEDGAAKTKTPSSEDSEPSADSQQPSRDPAGNSGGQQEGAPNDVAIREPGLANRNVQPDVIASIKERPSALVLGMDKQDDIPPPVAPPRKKKKPKSFETPTPEIKAVIKELSDTPVGDEKTTVGLPPESGDTGRPLSGLLTPTTTIESITKELEHSLDLASATSDNIVLHMETQSIKGESRAEVLEALKNPPPPKPPRGQSGSSDAKSGNGGSKSKGNTPDTDTLAQYYALMKGQSTKGEMLTDEEVLSQVIVRNLDTGEAIPLLLAEEQLPQCINPLALHIMRITSEYPSNSSLDKEGASDGEKTKSTAAGAKKSKSKKLKFKKILSKIKNAADEAFRHEEQESSDEESLPDSRTMKIKAANSNKGPYDFDQLRLAQDLGREHAGAVWTMKFSPCGRLLATAGQDRMLRVWVLKDHYKYFDDMRQRYSNESREQDRASSLERERRGSQEVIEERPEDEDDQEAEKKETAVQPEEEAQPELADTPLRESALDDEMAVFARTPFFEYSGHTADVLDVSWSKNYFILSSSMDKTVRLWHISRNECLCCFQHIDFVTAIAFHPRDDRYFLSGSLDGKLRLWNIPDKKVALWNEVDGPTKLITAANFIQNGRFAVVGTYDGRCIFYDTEHLKYYSQIHVRSTRGRNAVGRKVTAIEPLPGQDKILVTSNDSRLRLYDLRDLSLTCKYKGCTNVSSQIRASFSHNFRYIVCGSEDHCIYIWKTCYDFAKFTSVRKDRNDFWESIKANDAVVTTAVFSPQPSLVIKQTDPTPPTPLDTAPSSTESKHSPITKAKREMIHGKTETKAEKKSSLKRFLDQGEVLVCGDFNGAIKVFIKRPKS